MLQPFRDPKNGASFSLIKQHPRIVVKSSDSGVRLSLTRCMILRSLSHLSETQF